jgi:hypothetical protein
MNALPPHWISHMVLHQDWHVEPMGEWLSTTASTDMRRSSKPVASPRRDHTPTALRAVARRG